MLVRCEAHKVCKGKHISYPNGCFHSKFHKCESSDCFGYCGTVDKFVMCDEPSRKDKLEAINKISNKKYKYKLW